MTIDGLQRFEFDELSPELQRRLSARVERLGYLGDFFRFSAAQPEVLTSFIDLTEHLRSALPLDLTEVVALRAAKHADNAYERHQHERYAVKNGLGPEWVSAVLGDEARPAELDEAQVAVSALVDTLVAGFGKDARLVLEAAAAHIGAPAAIAVLFLVGRYLTHAMVCNALQLVPPVPSIFDQERS